MPGLPPVEVSVAIESAAEMRGILEVADFSEPAERF